MKAYTLKSFGIKPARELTVAEEAFFIGKIAELDQPAPVQAINHTGGIALEWSGGGLITCEGIVAIYRTGQAPEYYVDTAGIDGAIKYLMRF